MRLTTRGMLNIATSIRSNIGWSRGSAIGRIRRFIATCARACFRSIGAATPKRSVSADLEATPARLLLRGACRLERRITPCSNPPYGLRAAELPDNPTQRQNLRGKSALRNVIVVYPDVILPIRDVSGLDDDGRWQYAICRWTRTHDEQCHKVGGWALSPERHALSRDR